MYWRLLLLGIATSTLAGCEDLPVEKIPGKYKVISLEQCVGFTCSLNKDAAGVEFSFTQTELADGRQQICYDFFSGQPECLVTDEIHEKISGGAFTTTTDYLANLTIDAKGFNFESSKRERTFVTDTQETVRELATDEKSRFFRTQDGFVFNSTASGTNRGLKITIKNNFKLELVSP